MISLYQLGRTLRTIRHLRSRQIIAYAGHRLRGSAQHPRRSTAGGLEGLTPCRTFWVLCPEGEPSPEGGVSLVGRPAFDPGRAGWGKSANPLWSQTLHYHGWLNHPRVSVETGRSTIECWIDEHPRGIGWEPYPTSMRVLHWLGWLHRHGTTLQTRSRERVLASLAAQLEHLAGRTQTHWGGHHLWTNLVALCAAGMALRGSRPQWLIERFGPRLVRTVIDQVAVDGMHRQCSPTDHCRLTEQLAMLHALARLHRPRLASALAPTLSAMIDVLPAFTHPDGDVALWGDSERDAPVTPARLATRLDRSLPHGHADAPKSGFSRRCWGPWTLLWNRIAHCHSDALSIELSWGTTRLLVDAGVGTHAPGPDRNYMRSTAAHNTVTVGVGARNQHEAWASHSTGALAQAELLACTEHRLAAQVMGYASPSAHRRAIEFRDNVIRITDTVEQPIVPATVRYFVNAEHRVDVRGNIVTIEIGGRRCELRAVGPSWHYHRAPGWAGVGRPAPRICLSLPVDPRGTVVEIR